MFIWLRYDDVLADRPILRAFAFAEESQDAAVAEHPGDCEVAVRFPGRGLVECAVAVRAPGELVGVDVCDAVARVLDAFDADFIVPIASLAHITYHLTKDASTYPIFQYPTSPSAVPHEFLAM